MPPVSAREPFEARALSRRAAPQLLAAGAASLAAGCSRPDEEIVAHDTLVELPYVRMPEGLVPGIAERYATALPLAGYGHGALVTSFEGRPIKVEDQAPLALQHFADLVGHSGSSGPTTLSAGLTVRVMGLAEATNSSGVKNLYALDGF